MAVEHLLYAGNSLAKAVDIFARAIIRQRTRVLQHFQIATIADNGARADMAGPAACPAESRLILPI